MTYPRLDAALRFAVERHAGQERDGDHALPYITHPFEVLMNLRVIGGVIEEDLLCAAALHDVIEETDTTLAELEQAFGPEVASLVRELTRYEPTPEETSGLSKPQIREMRSQILLSEIAQMSPAAMTVKLADRLANLREAIRTRAGERLRTYLAQTERILEIVPADVNPTLHAAIRAEIDRGSSSR